MIFKSSHYFSCISLQLQGDISSSYYLHGLMDPFVSDRLKYPILLIYFILRLAQVQPLGASLSGLCVL